MPRGPMVGTELPVSNRSNGAGQLEMMQIGLIGIGAGAAAALLFASVASGSWLSIILFYLAPLPVMIAGLGWSHWSALIAAFTGAVALALVFGGYFLFAFLAGTGLPGAYVNITLDCKPSIPAAGSSSRKTLNTGAAQSPNSSQFRTPVIPRKPEVA